jgi:hypothetical protein
LSLQLAQFEGVGRGTFFDLGGKEYPFCGELKWNYKLQLPVVQTFLQVSQLKLFYFHFVWVVLRRWSYQSVPCMGCFVLGKKIPQP